MKLIVWSKRIAKGPNVEWLKGIIHVHHQEDTTGTILVVIDREPKDLVIEEGDILTLDN